MKKLQEILEFLEDLITQTIDKRIASMKAQYHKRKTEVQDEWFKRITSCAAGRSGCFVISYLRSSYITGTHEYKLTFFQGKPYEEEYPEISFYSMAHYLTELEEDVKILLKQADRTFIRIFDWRLEEIEKN
jgi:hypothetical protein